MKTFPVKLADDLHIKIKIEAAKTGKTMGDWILGAIEEKLKHKAEKPKVGG